jgi:nucleoside-diphosphate-sugar epimerase
MAELAGNKFHLLPSLPVGPLRTIAIEAARVIEHIAHAFSFHSPLEADSVDYLGRDFHFSNLKLKNTGYKFVFADARDGLRDTYNWYKANGWL